MTNAGYVPDFNSGPNSFPFFRFVKSKAQGTRSILSATTFYMMVVYRVNMPSTSSFPYFPYPGSIGGASRVFDVNGVYFGNTGPVPARYIGYNSFLNFTDAAPVFDRDWHFAEFFLTAGSPNAPQLLIDGVSVPVAGAFACPTAPLNTIVRFARTRRTRTLRWRSCGTVTSAATPTLGRCGPASATSTGFEPSPIRHSSITATRPRRVRNYAPCSACPRRSPRRFDRAADRERPREQNAAGECAAPARVLAAGDGVSSHPSGFM